MKHLGMLPSTRLKLFGAWLAVFVVGLAFIASATGDGVYLLGWLWFIVSGFVYLVVARSWEATRAIQVNLEWERRLRGK
jgi:hypothetical protein